LPSEDEDKEDEEEEDSSFRLAETLVPELDSDGDDDDASLAVASLLLSTPVDSEAS